MMVHVTGYEDLLNLCILLLFARCDEMCQKSIHLRLSMRHVFSECFSYSHVTVAVTHMYQCKDCHYYTAVQSLALLADANYSQV